MNPFHPFHQDWSASFFRTEFDDRLFEVHHQWCMFGCNHLNNPGQTNVKKPTFFEMDVRKKRNLLIVGALLQKSNETVANGLPEASHESCWPSIIPSRV
jgi:hypothetical protein